MQSCVKVLVLDVSDPFPKGSGSLEIPCLGKGAVNDFETRCSCTHIVLPHVEAQLELSTPEIIKFAFHSAELTALLASEALVEHPLFKLSIENKSLCMMLRKELWDLLVLFEKHHRITSDFEPSGKGVLSLSLITM